ncbi:stress responsive A/B barrel domain protein [Lepidopterella palustris CBS 459.81]|uniref:Stress responsive A/B barrel domain protein n=1 Tax=Lepidopterella palustris CBS 459.81 TaxID=1314670 RepID=A0A8E2E1F3_9PEZI|nr:stress responsive A/B barrel domain protein [Lepidopterella palustris CBS 459.81]
MGIVHIVLFEFKPTTSHKQVEDVCKRMLELQHNCIHPTTQKPYINSVVGGRDNSPEGHQGGFSHGFVCQFENEEDREYYVKKDPMHLAFVKSLDGILQNVRVVDFEPGKF